MSLRRSLTLAFASVALATVGLTSTLTLRAALDAQQQITTVIVTRSRAPEARRDPTRDPAHPKLGLDNPEADPWPFAAGPRDWPAFQQWDVRTQQDAIDVWRGLRSAALASALAAGAVAAVAAGILAHRLTLPLRALADGASRLARGERGLRLRVPRGSSEFRPVTEAFNALVAGLERQEAWRRSIVADVAHDLRTPLSVLRSEIEAMQDGLATPDDAGLERLRREVLLLARLVEDLRSLSMAESGGLSLRVERVSVTQALERTRAAFESRAHEAGARLVARAAPPSLAVRADPDRLAQTLGNLVDNAIRHGGAGEVELEADRAGDTVRLRVRDRGPGLSPEALERAFERFWRADPARSRERGVPRAGSGLGLAIARALVEAQGGRLEAANRPEGGAEFTLELPAA